MNYSLEMLLEASTLIKGATGQLKGKAEQKAIATIAQKKENISKFVLVGVTSTGNGPDVLLYYIPDDRFYEIEVKSTGGGKNIYTVEEALGQTKNGGIGQTVKFGPSNKSASSTWQNANAKTQGPGLGESAFFKAFNQGGVTLTDGHWGAMSIAKSFLKHVDKLKGCGTGITNRKNKRTTYYQYPRSQDQVGRAASLHRPGEEAGRLGMAEGW